MTSRPSSVSSWAMIEPVQPRPMMTTSFLGSLPAMAASASLRCPVRSAHDADRRKRKALVVTADPVEIIVARPRKSDHSPRDHVAIAAMDRISKEPLFDVRENLLEERRAIGTFELHFPMFETA